MYRSWATIPPSLYAGALPALVASLTRSQVTIVSGAAGGFLQGMSGVGGPPLIVWSLSINMEKNALRATLVYIFAVASIVQSAVIYSMNSEVMMRDKCASLPAFCKYSSLIR